jgi:lysine-specific histone demethylase 1B
LSNATHLFQPSSPLYSDLNPSERVLATSLARAAEVGLGLPLERVARKWTGYEDAYKGTDAAPVGGYSQVIDGLVKLVTSNGGEVTLGEKVIDVVYPLNRPEGEDDSIVVITNDSTTGQEKSYEGRLVICTIPLAVLKSSLASFWATLSPSTSKTMFNPPFSDQKLQVIAGTHVGQLGKLVITYPSAWWPTDVGTFTLLPPNPSNSATVDQTNPSALLDTVTLVVSSFALPSSPHPHPTLLIYLPAPITRQIEILPVETVTKAAHQLLISRLSPTTADTAPPSPTHASLTSWSTSPFSLGATTTPPITDPSRSPLDYHELAKPEWGNRLLFAGEHTSVGNRGSVAGAVESGLREGDRARRLLKNWEA